MRCTMGIAIALALAACGSDAPRNPVHVTVPSGATFAVVLDSLVARGVVTGPRRFKLYARMTGADREIRAGDYELSPGVIARRDDVGCGICTRKGIEIVVGSKSNEEVHEPATENYISKPAAKESRCVAAEHESHLARAA